MRPWCGRVLLLASLGLLILGGSGCALFDCGVEESMAMPHAEFVGEVTHKSGSDVTYRILRVVPVSDHPPTGRNVTAGSTVVVTYEDGARFLHTGSRYLVKVWTLPGDDRLYSAVNTRRCGTSSTWHADGSSIDTGLFTRDGFRPWVAVAIGVPLLLIGWAIAHVVRDRMMTARAARRFAEEGPVEVPK